jgi:hypothetical protein
MIVKFHKGVPVMKLLIVERNAVKIWRVILEDGVFNLEEQYNLAIHKDIQTAMHVKGNIVLVVQGNLCVTVDEQVVYG